MIYLVTFALSYFFGRKAGEVTEKSFFWCFLAIMPFCVTAAFRAPSVGTDVEVYALPMYEYASWCSLPEMLTGRYQGAVEPLFSIYVWLTTKVFGSLEAVLFFLQFASVAPFSYAVFKLAPSQLGSSLLLYGLAFYGFSLNIMRQSIAISILCVALILLLRGRKLCPLLLIVLAAGFHQTALIGIALLPLAVLLSDSGNQRIGELTSRRGLCVVSLCGLLICVCVLFGDDLLAFIGGMKDSYIEQVENAGQGGFSSAAFILGLSPVAALLFVGRSISPERFSRSGGTALVTLGAMGSLLSQFSMLSPQMSRIGMIFLPFSLFAFVSISAALAKPRFFSLPNCIAIVACAMYFLVVYVLGRSGEIFPYSSSVLPWAI